MSLPLSGAEMLVLDQISASCFFRGGFDLLFNQAEPRGKAFSFAPSTQPLQRLSHSSFPQIATEQFWVTSDTTINHSLVAVNSSG